MNKFAIVCVIAACFVSSLSAHKKKSSSKAQFPASPDVPVLAVGTPIVIKGEETGDIFANDVKLYEWDRKFREKGSLHIELGEDNCLYANHRMVLKQDPQNPIITKNPNLRAKKVAYYEIQIDDKGQITYVVKTFV